MINRLKTLFAAQEQRRHDHDELKLAAAALLAEAAHLDGAVDVNERTAIEHALARRFGLSQAEAASLAAEGIAAAEKSTQIFGFTRIINDRFDQDERIELFEMLYEVIYADDELHAYEDNLMRRLSELIYVPDKERGAARLRVLKRLGRST